MATEEYSIGYQDGYQDGWNKAVAEQPARVPLTEGELLSMWSGGDERFMRPVLGKNKILAFALAVIAAYEAKNGIGGGK